jgi:hypothetical protein
MVMFSLGFLGVDGHVFLSSIGVHVCVLLGSVGVPSHCSPRLCWCLWLCSFCLYCFSCGKTMDLDGEIIAVPLEVESCMLLLLICSQHQHHMLIILQAQIIHNYGLCWQKIENFKNLKVEQQHLAHFMCR